MLLNPEGEEGGLVMHDCVQARETRTKVEFMWLMFIGLFIVFTYYVSYKRRGVGSTNPGHC